MSTPEDRLRRAVYYRRELGYTRQRAAREAHVDPKRLAAYEKTFEDKAPTRRGDIMMQSVNRDGDIKYVIVDDVNASKNGSYLNYVKWSFYEQRYSGRRGELVRREFVDEGELLKGYNNVGDFIVVKAVYGAHLDMGMWMPDDYPENDYGEEGEIFEFCWDMDDLADYVDETEDSNPNVYTKK